MALGFIELFGILFIIIVLFSFLSKLVKQPIIVGYILAGLFFSIFLAKDTMMSEQVTMMADLGITFLLFLMGLEFDLRTLKYLGKDILIATGLQSIVFFAVAFAVTMLFPFTIIEKIYLSILFMFGSTLLVAKWIEDKKESNSLYAKLTMGILIMQDVIAIIAITILSVVSEKNVLTIVLAPLKGLALIVIAFILAKYLLNYMLKFSSKYPELLFVFSLGICFFFVEIAELLGYSTTIGAFIAGITLGNTIYKNDVSVKLKPLIIFFNMLFFVGLGLQMNVSINFNYIIIIAIFLVMCFLIKPFVTYLTLRYRGFDMKTCFLASINLAQMSEFGIIIMTGGIASGIIDKMLGAVAVISVIISMVFSSYLIKRDRKIYGWCEHLVQKIDSKIMKKEIAEKPLDLDCNILFIGYYELGKEIYSKLHGMGKKILVIDNDPQNIDMLEKEQIPYTYGSINDPAIFEHIPFEKIELIVSGSTDMDENKALIHELKEKNPKAVAIVNAKSLKDSLTLYKYDADYVIYPTYVNEQKVSVLLEDYTTDIHKMLSKKIEDIARLKEKEEKTKEESDDRNMFYEIDHFIHRMTAKNKDEDVEDKKEKKNDDKKKDKEKEEKDKKKQEEEKKKKDEKENKEKDVEEKEKKKEKDKNENENKKD